MNRLAASTSPYLRQHQDDPVDWYPWGEEAFARSRELNRPLFLSIGYSACHWCHVMGHESFADPVTAAEMNDLVVAVKVDREERPDVDAVYMEAVQAATGHGGWPMSVFATPDGRPFYAGTYFPNRSGRGTPAFREVLHAIGDAWKNKRDQVDEQADLLCDAVAKRLGPPPQGDVPGGSRAALEAACIRLGEMFDEHEGGFGSAPKFPQPLLLEMLLVAHTEGIGQDLSPSPLEIVVTTIEAMASGGIWDHLGGGMARYSVDREWLVPHFEKMLYDQALLGRLYLHAWQVTGDRRWLQVLEEIVAYVLGDLGLDSGGLASAEDADSEGEEGLFYTWTPTEISALLSPEEAEAALSWWRVEASGNFDGRSILRPVRGHLERTPVIEKARLSLLAARSTRTRPGLDDKLLAEWNAMMCATLAEAALATSRDDWREAAERIGTVLIKDLRRHDGRVLRTPARSDGETLGYAADAAWMAEAFYRLFTCTGQMSWLTAACDLADQLVEVFEDTEEGGCYITGNDAEELVVRPRDIYDNVIPAAGSVAVGTLARLSAITGRTDFEESARRLLKAGSAILEKAPTAIPSLAVAANLLEAGAIEIVIVGERPDLLAAAAASFVPRAVIVWAAPGQSVDSPLFETRAPAQAYVCHHGVCGLPARTAAVLKAQLGATAQLSQTEVAD